MSTHSQNDELRARLRERYKPTDVPPCRVCGGPLSIASIGGGKPTEWACDGNEDDPDKPGYVRPKAGRFGNAPEGAPSEFDPGGHYYESRWTDYRQGGDPDVIALLDSLTPAAVAGEAGDGMLPDVLAPHAKEWYRLCERRYYVERITISGKLAEAIVEAVGGKSMSAPVVAGEAVRDALRVAHSHLDMAALRISHCKDAAIIDRALATAGDSAVGWQPIETAPDNVDVWVFDPECMPRQFVATLTERDPSVGGFYWRPADELVADVLDYELAPTHWQPLPTPPAAQGAK